MKTLSVRVRLTLWYAAVLGVTLAAFAGGMFFALEQSVHAAVDDELRTRFDGVQRFMQRRIPQMSLDELQDEFREHSELKPGGDLLQVADAQGKWIFRSGSIQQYQLPPAAASEVNVPRLETVTVRGSPLRTLSARVQIEGQPYTLQLAGPIGAYSEMISRFGWLALWSVPIVLLLASAGGYWMSRRALAPVDEITATARSISVQSLNLRLSVPHTGDELQRLSETLNEMMARLDSAFKKITQFTADASHELRTPVALIRTTAELALRKQRSEEEYRNALHQIRAEGERTTSLIENLMTLASADSGVERLPVTTVDLTKTLQEACDQGATLAEAKQIAFDSDIPNKRVSVEGDSQSLRRLFLILIDNAVKYTPPGGRIVISLTTSDSFAVSEVRDTGIGISAADLPNVFERFYRADKARSRDMGGAGLGLSIAKWIADAHHGEIQAESKVEKGSTFRVRLPLSAFSSNRAATLT
jgi:heavy metal sensor kinase